MGVPKTLAQPDTTFRDLRERARELQGVLRRQARRPFVLEITGTPKAGKTTLIGMLSSFLRDSGWRVHVLKERAGECPLPMKGHFFFNTWTTGTMLAGLLDAVDRDLDLVVLDRGIFDALIWLELQKRDGQVSQAERHAFEAFVTLDRWRRLTDLVCLLEVDPQVAMDRENENRLLPRSGSIMQPKRLVAFNNSLKALRAHHQGDFRFISIANTETARDGARRMIERVLTQARAWSDPKIAVVRRRDARMLVPNGIQPWTRILWNNLKTAITYRHRSAVEGSDEWVQPMACGAQTFEGRVFLAVRRRAREDVVRSRENTALIWKGCHIHMPNGGALDLRYLKGVLLDRLKNDLHLAELKATPRPLGLVWDPAGREPRHLGIMFQVPVSGNVADFLDEREFKTNGRGYRVENSFVESTHLSHDESVRRGYTLEEWSRLIHEAKWLTKV